MAKDPKIQDDLPKIIEKVELGLETPLGVKHDVMKPDGLNNFEKTYFACKKFNTTMTIFWRHETGLEDKPTTLYHTLCFKGDGKWKIVAINFPRKVLVAFK